MFIVDFMRKKTNKQKQNEKMSQPLFRRTFLAGQGSLYKVFNVARQITVHAGIFFDTF